MLLCTGQEKGGERKNIACLLPLRKDRWSGLRNRNVKNYENWSGTRSYLGKEGLNWPWMREKKIFKETFPSSSPE